MPAKVKVTKEMVIDAAFTVARETGAENINARTVSERLNCSTQPEYKKPSEGGYAWNRDELHPFRD